MAGVERTAVRPGGRGAPADGEVRLLADLRPGTRARVVRVLAGAGPVTARRLAELGFTPGAEVHVVRQAPLRDPVEYRIKDYDLCLRRAQAACVETRVEAGSAAGV